MTLKSEEFNKIDPVLDEVKKFWKENYPNGKAIRVTVTINGPSNTVEVLEFDAETSEQTT